LSRKIDFSRFQQPLSQAKINSCIIKVAQPLRKACIVESLILLTSPRFSPLSPATLMLRFWVPDPNAVCAGIPNEIYFRLTV
jgi:hypothetical protein